MFMIYSALQFIAQLVCITEHSLSIILKCTAKYASTHCKRACVCLLPFFFQSIDPSQQFTWEYSNLEVNKPKNRYANVIAYDHTRVVLAPIEGERPAGSRGCLCGGRSVRGVEHKDGVCVFIHVCVGVLVAGGGGGDCVMDEN